MKEKLIDLTMECANMEPRRSQELFNLRDKR